MNPKTKINIHKCRNQETVDSTSSMLHNLSEKKKAGDRSYVRITLHRISKIKFIRGENVSQQTKMRLDLAKYLKFTFPGNLVGYSGKSVMFHFIYFIYISYGCHYVSLQRESLGDRSNTLYSTSICNASNDLKCVILQFRHLKTIVCTHGAEVHMVP